MPTLLFAWEPYPIDVTQQNLPEEGHDPDHLEPLSQDDSAPESYYLIRYFHDIAMANQNTGITIYRDEKNGRFYLERWNEWRNEKEKHPVGQVLEPGTKLEIPEDLVRIVYEMWVNALFEVHYDRRFDGTLDGWTDIFSAYLRGKGWLHGTADCPEKDLPPKWLEGTACALILFSKNRDAKACRTTIFPLHDKLFACFVETFS